MDYIFAQHSIIYHHSKTLDRLVISWFASNTMPIFLPHLFWTYFFSSLLYFVVVVVVGFFLIPFRCSFIVLVVVADTDFVVLHFLDGLRPSFLCFIAIAVFFFYLFAFGQRVCQITSVFLCCSLTPNYVSPFFGRFANARTVRACMGTTTQTLKWILWLVRKRERIHTQPSEYTHVIFTERMNERCIIIIQPDRRKSNFDFILHSI